MRFAKIGILGTALVLTMGGVWASSIETAAASVVFSTGNAPANAVLLENFDELDASVNLPPLIVSDQGTFKGSVINNLQTVSPSARPGNEGFFGGLDAQTIDLSAPARYFGFRTDLIEGSITLMNGDDIIQRFSEQQIGADRFEFANFISDKAFNKIVFDGDFIIDDLKAATSISAVPLPATLPLFSAAIGGIGLFARKRKRPDFIARA